LITHWGVSGPAVLKLSAFAARELYEIGYEFSVRINWCGEMKEQELRSLLQNIREISPQAHVENKLVVNLPSRLWKLQCQRSGIPDSMRYADLPSAAANRLIRHLLLDEYPVKGKTTFKEEFVTAGGVSLKEINPLTMESRLQPGLFFAEVMDVDGVTGGFNFQHAWTSGFIAGRLGK
jgi:predicted Rossmann fold flavoprotein